MLLGDREWAELWVMSELLMVVWQGRGHFVASHVLSVPGPDENGQAGLGLPPAHSNQQKHSVKPPIEHTGPIKSPCTPLSNSIRPLLILMLG